MKRFYALGMVFLLSMPIHAAEKNKIKMVTYFPVPYVAYSQVNVTEQMDIGLTSTCDMTLGCSKDSAGSALGCSDGSATLEAGQVNLNRGKLNLDGGLGINGKVLDLGSGSGDGKISFRNVRIQTGHMESVNAQDITVDTLELFGKLFPSCASANNKSNGQMQWQKLRLKGADKDELYLTCGEPVDARCQPPRGAVYTDPCPEGQTGTGVQYTWDYATCSYKPRASCSSGLKRYLTNYKCTGLNKPLHYEILDENRVQDCVTVQNDNMYWEPRSAYGYLSDFRQIPDGCSPGKECASCVPGKRYISDNMFPGHTCRRSELNAPERDRILLVVKYVSCGEHATPYIPEPDATCMMWSDVGDDGELFEPPVSAS